MNLLNINLIRKKSQEFYKIIPEFYQSTPRMIVRRVLVLIREELRSRDGKATTDGLFCPHIRQIRNIPRSARPERKTTYPHPSSDMRRIRNGKREGQKYLFPKQTTNRLFS